MLSLKEAFPHCFIDDFEVHDVGGSSESDPSTELSSNRQWFQGSITPYGTVGFAYWNVFVFLDMA